MRYIIILFLSVLFSFKLQSCDSPVAKENSVNIKKIEVGMTIKEVKKIMGEPEKTVIQPFNENEIELQYLSPSGYSDHFRVFISRSDSIVLRIGDGL